MAVELLSLRASRRRDSRATNAACMQETVYSTA